jgi:hypothetical protein
MVCLHPAILSCGKTTQKVDVQDASSVSSASNSTVSDPNCKKSSCPKVEFSLVDGNGRDLSIESFSGALGVAVDWKLRVKSDAPAGRIKIVMLEKPSWMEPKATAEPGALDITDTPDLAATNASFIVLARDITRCKVLEKVTKSCTDIKASFKEYDTLFNIKFSVTGN